MKSKLFLPMHILCIGTFFCTILSVNGISQTRFLKQYNLSPNQLYTDAEQSPYTKNMYVAGTINDIPGGIFLSKIDSNGHQKFFKEYTGNFKHMEIFDIYIQPDDQLFLTGHVRGFNSSNDMLLMHIDSSGTLLSTDLYLTPDSNEIGYSLTGHANGDLFVAGSMSADNNQNKNFLLSNVSASGNMNWNITYDTKNEDILHSIVPTDSSEFYLGGDMRDSSSWKALVIKVDASGNLLWAKSYAHPLSGHGFYESKIYAASDGGFLIGSNVFDYGNWSRHALIKADENGNILWSRLVWQGSYHQAGDIREDIDGNYLISGALMTSPNRGYAIKISPLGNVLWTNSYELGDQDMVEKIFPKSNTYTLVGTATHNFQILTTDSMAVNSCVNEHISFLNSSFHVVVTPEKIRTSSPLTQQNISLSQANPILSDTLICADTACDLSQLPTDLGAHIDTANNQIVFDWTPTPGSDSCQAGIRALIPGTGMYVVLSPAFVTPPFQYPTDQIRSKFIRLGVRCFCEDQATDWTIANINLSFLPSLKQWDPNGGKDKYAAFYNGQDIVVQSNINHTKASGTIYNVLGQKVHPFTFSSSSGSIHIDAGTYQLHGQYIISLLDEDGSVYVKSVWIP